MNQKRNFTLIEMIVTVVIISIIASIVVVKILDLKKSSIHSAVANNTQIIQTAVDRYALDNNGEYPLKNKLDLTLSSPRYIDIDKLNENGYLKKDLDLKKIKKQHYLLDVFGIAWGSTEKTVENMVMLTTKSGEKALEFNLSEGISTYRIYEVTGYTNNGIRMASTNKGTVTPKSTGTNSNYYKMIEEVKVKKENNRINFTIPDSSKVYLISTVDGYDLESAPAGVNYKGSAGFKPITGEGEYDFEISSLDTMYWIDFKTIQQTPGKSKIEYSFAVKNADGGYMDWVDDYYSLPPSTGIKVKVKLIADGEEKPSLYDLRVVYRYEYEPVPPILTKRPPKFEDFDQSKICPAGGEVSSINDSGILNGITSEGQVVYPFIIPVGMTIGDIIPPALDVPYSHTILDISYEYYQEGSGYVKVQREEGIPSDNCVHIIYKIKVNKPIVEKPESSLLICGNGGSETNIYGAKVVDETKESTIVYGFKLLKGQSIGHISIPVSGTSYYTYAIKSVKYEYSHKGTDYVIANSLSEIPVESCVNVVYEIDVNTPETKVQPLPPEVHLCIDDCPKVCTDCIPTCLNGGCGTCVEPDCINEETDKIDCNLNECIDPEPCNEGDPGCTPPVCANNCSDGPPKKSAPKDSELTDPEWKTVDTMRFFAHGAEGQITNWLDWKKVDILPENTRIVYRFSKSNGNYWTNELDNFYYIGQARSVVVIAYLQVKTTEVNKVGQKRPDVENIILTNEKGVVDIKAAMPNLVIIPEKDNNKGRDVFSDYSNIEWTYEASDPRGKTIKSIEWSGDIRENYPVGTYTIRARVMNGSNIWSNWVSFTFDVKQEKPVAVISKDTPVVMKDKKVVWSAAQSYDLDGDKIVKFEWRGDKKDIYTETGPYMIELRVQDDEGHWSEWTKEEFTIIEKGTIVYRIEAEDSNTSKVAKSWSTLNGKVVQMTRPDSSITFYIEGTGFDLKFSKLGEAYVSIDGGKKVRVNKTSLSIYSVHSLENKAHTVTITSAAPYGSPETDVDYLDVYNIDDKPEVRFVNSFKVENGKENNVPTKILNLRFDQQLKSYYDLHKDSYVTVNILNPQGEIIRVLKEDSFETGGTTFRHFVLWDGKDSLGDKVSEDIYNVQIIAKGVTKKQSTTISSGIQVENKIPVYRIEAEDTNTSNVTKSWTTVNGKVVQMTRVDSVITFKFEGTGFDLKFSKLGLTYVSVDGGSKVYVNKESSSTYSVYNLENKVHTLTISSYMPYGSPEADIDYLDVYNIDDKPKIQLFKSVAVENGKENNIPTKLVNLNLNQQIKYYYDLHKNAYVTVNVLNPQGETIRTLKADFYEAGGTTYRHFILWDGKDSLGNLVPADLYEVQITAKGVTKKQSTTISSNIQVENKIPAYKIEAEEYSSRVTRSWVTVSGKNVLMTRGDSAITFKFEGTGFDLKFSRTGETYVSIDGGNRVLVNKASISNYSIHNLENKTHTLTITSAAPYGSPEADIDYLNVYK